MATPPVPVRSAPERVYPPRRRDLAVWGAVFVGVGGGVAVALWVNPGWAFGGTGFSRFASILLGVCSLVVALRAGGTLFGGDITVTNGGLRNSWCWLPRRRHMGWTDIVSVSLRPLPGGYAALLLHLKTGDKSRVPLASYWFPEALQADILQSWALGNGRPVPTGIPLWNPSMRRRGGIGSDIGAGLLGAVVATRVARLFLCEGGHCGRSGTFMAVFLGGAAVGFAVYRLARHRSGQSEQPGSPEGYVRSLSEAATGHRAEWTEDEDTIIVPLAGVPPADAWQAVQSVAQGHPESPVALDLHECPPGYDTEVGPLLDRLARLEPPSAFREVLLLSVTPEVAQAAVTFAQQKGWHWERWENLVRVFVGNPD